MAPYLAVALVFWAIAAALVSAVPDCAFSCTCLGDLVDCSHKGLADVPPDLPPWTKILDLTHNKMASLDGTPFARLRNLTELDLSHNQLRLVNGSSLWDLPLLAKLNLNHNHLVELPDLGQQPSLQELSAEHNEIHSLSSFILDGLPRLHTLQLGFNHLVDLPADTFGNSSSLKYLSLIHNRLVGIERGVFDNLTALDTLQLSKNRLSLLPKELFRQLSSLQTLEMNSLELGVIEGLTFQGLSSLSVLRLRHAGITTLQDGAFYGLSAIKKLQLDSNNIEKVTKGWLYGLNSLQKLHINNNNISEIEDDAWDSGKRLMELDMSHNRLESITSKTFEKLYTLKKLVLSNNRISYIEEDSFRDLAALHHLELGDNDAWWSVEEAGVFTGLRALRILGLGGNRVRWVSARALAGLPRLQELNLTGNPIAAIERGALDALPKLRDLYMNTSSLLCDCRLSWMAQGFEYKQVHAKCGHPARLKGVSIFQVTPSQMLCNESGVRPELLREPLPSRSTLKGENVTLECQAASTLPTSIHWRKDGRLLQSAGTVQETSTRRDGRTLTTSVLGLRSIRDEDEGRYQCVSTNEFGSAYSNKARIIVNVFPVFTKTPSDVSVRSGQTARLECGARGQPRPVITWRKDDAREDFPAARDRRMHVMPSDDVFFIVNARPQDAGLYSCYARNAAGTVSYNATLTVLEFPSFVRRMEDKEVRAGETAVLECLVAGSPRPALTWLLSGRPITPSERYFYTAKMQLLIIVQAQMSDAGPYSCNISNSLGWEEGHTHLKVNQGGGGGGIGLLSGTEEGGAGVVVIAVVICIVGTSIVWVVIIYHTRKHREEFQPPNTHRKQEHFLDSCSGVSKDSGQQSSSGLLLEDNPLLDTSPRLAHTLGESSSGSERSGSSVSKERVPLLHTFRNHHQRTAGRHCVARYQASQRSQSAEQLQGEPPDEPTTLPRSVTLASVSHSPHLARLIARDVPNDSGSFSIASEDPTLQEHSRSVTLVATTTLPSSSPCTCNVIVHA